MALKNYKVTTTTADTDTDLISTLSGVDVIILSFEIIAPTAGVVEIKRNDGTNDYAPIALNLDAGDIVALDHKIVIPDGHKLIVKSDQTDTEFIVNVDEE